MSRKAPLVIKWPDRECVTAFLTYGCLLGVLWVLVYGGASWFTGRHDYRLQLGFAAEAAIPFVPAAAVVYLSLFPFLWMSLFVLHSPGELKSFARALAWLFIISGIGFVFLPATQPNPPPPSDGWTRPVFGFADWINLDYNFCPSLHVGMATLCAYAYTRRGHPLASLLVWLWAIAISVSTLVTHQHYLIDVAAGAALGYLIAKHVFRTSWESSSPTKNSPSTAPEAAAGPAPQQ
jgi:membrane-associated phospholipid phosphatase